MTDAEWRMADACAAASAVAGVTGAIAPVVEPAPAPSPAPAALPAAELSAVPVAEAATVYGAPVRRASGSPPPPPPPALGGCGTTNWSSVDGSTMMTPDGKRVHCAGVATVGRSAIKVRSPPMTLRHAKVRASHTRIVLSREPVTILSLKKEKQKEKEKQF
jgi:hypothetical protein